MNWILILLYALFFGFLTAYIAERKGYNSYSWFWLGILLGFIATGILIVQPSKTKQKPINDLPTTLNK
ncbi:MAG: hypothetical protein GWP19_03050 [Planctomycetia bacterium]|nr:hypothetical protein [Planctomycetia bacterium]